MAKRSIEETFKMVKPKGQKGIPSPPTIGVGVSSNNSDLGTALSQAGQQIAQLQSAYQQQAALIQANTAGGAGQHLGARQPFRAGHGGRDCIELAGWIGTAVADYFGNCEFVRRRKPGTGAIADLYAAAAGFDQRDAEFGGSRGFEPRRRRRQHRSQ